MQPSINVWSIHRSHLSNVKKHVGPWSPGLSALEHIGSMLRHSHHYGEYDKFMKKLMNSPACDRVSL